jgi:hypothetical protein
MYILERNLSVFHQSLEAIAESHICPFPNSNLPIHNSRVAPSNSTKYYNIIIYYNNNYIIASLSNKIIELHICLTLFNVSLSLCLLKNRILELALLPSSGNDIKAAVLDPLIIFIAVRSAPVVFVDAVMFIRPNASAQLSLAMAFSVKTNGDSSKSRPAVSVPTFAIDACS